MCVTASVIRGKNMEPGTLVNTRNLIAELPYYVFVTRASVHEGDNILLVLNYM